MAGLKLPVDQNRTGQPQPFYRYADGQAVAMDGAAKVVTVAGTADVVRVANRGAATLWARGDGQAAIDGSAACVAVEPGEVEWIPLMPGNRTLSLIGASGEPHVMPLDGTGD